jgi:sulfate transport system substrate-binding protein
VKRFLCLVILCTFAATLPAKEIELLNVSYDPTREFYKDFNRAFSAFWQNKTGQKVLVRQSHGGSAKQARAVMDGLDADVVTLALAYDIDMLHARGNLVPEDWQKKLPNNSCPYTSTIVFLVRDGNPKGIRDWEDLVKPGVSLVTPNPKTSGGARWNFLAGWAFAQRKYGSPEKAREFVEQLYKNVQVLDAGARGATTTFVHRGIGDVLIAWESEALTAVHESPAGKFQVITPSMSILAEPPVAVVEKITNRRGTTELARAYLDYLYSVQGQELAAKYHYRPTAPKVLEKFRSEFPSIELVTVTGFFGGWANAQKIHFADGGTFDQIYRK